MITNNLQYDLNILMVISVVGFIVRFVGGKTSDDGVNGPATSTIYGLGFVWIATITMLIIMFGLSNNMSAIQNLSNWEFAKKVLTTTIQPVLLLIILSWTILLNTTYMKEINQGKPPTEFKSFSTGSTLLTLIQLGALFYYASDQMKQLYGNITKSQNSKLQAFKRQISYLTYFISFINLVVLGVMTVILKYYMTDG